MLLSSTARAMYWTGRYAERALSLSRTVLGYEQLSLDLPGTRTLELRPLFELAGRAPSEAKGNRAATLRALVFDADNPSSVLGALIAAREALRQARVAAPPELWTTLGAMLAAVRDHRGAVEGDVPAALEALLSQGDRFEGERQSLMMRDAAYSFIEIGSQLERIDMLVRSLRELIPALLPQGWERAFDDVRWNGLLRTLSLHAAYRRLYHQRIDLPKLLELALGEASCPRAVAHALHAIEAELARLPRSGPLRTLLARLERDARAASRAAPAELVAELERCLAAVAEVHEAFESSFFPRDVGAAQPAQALQTQVLHESVARPAVDPFEHLGREHAEVEQLLRVLEELMCQAERGSAVDRAELGALMAFLNDFSELWHHEKEESILAPELVAHGFDWYSGPLSTMRREHRQEHYFVRVLSGLAQQRDDWSREDARSFVSVAREFCHFLRGHMDRERRDLFEQASRALPSHAKERLLQAFQALDARFSRQLLASRESVAVLLAKYRAAEGLVQAS